MHINLFICIQNGQNHKTLYDEWRDHNLQITIGGYKWKISTKIINEFIHDI